MGTSPRWTFFQTPRPPPPAKKFNLSGPSTFLNTIKFISLFLSFLPVLFLDAKFFVPLVIDFLYVQQLETADMFVGILAFISDSKSNWVGLSKLELCRTFSDFDKRFKFICLMAWQLLLGYLGLKWYVNDNICVQCRHSLIFWQWIK